MKSTPALPNNYLSYVVDLVQNTIIEFIFGNIDELSFNFCFLFVDARNLYLALHFISLKSLDHTCILYLMGSRFNFLKSTMQYIKSVLIIVR